MRVLRILTDAVEKVGWDALVSNNRIGKCGLFNRYCAFDRYLESKLLAPTLKIVFDSIDPELTPVDLAGR
jgi:hypothetical protein